MEEILVNGPVNVLRLEGYIFGIHKIIYIFMDIHSHVTTQTQCQSFDSMDFSQYIVKMLKISNKNKIFDIFTEISITEVGSPDHPFRGRYIDEVNRYVKREYNAGKKINSNLRVHYIDIRDFLKRDINNLIHDIHNTIRTLCYGYLSRHDFNALVSYFNSLKQNITTVNNYISGIDNPAKMDQNKDKVINKFINKILYKYKHQEIKLHLSELFKNISESFASILSLIDESINLLEKSSEFILKSPDKLFLLDYEDIEIFTYGKDNFKFIKFRSDLELLIDQIDILSMFNFSLIVDSFFLRRFLDKDYITNAIVYTGAAHSTVYIYFLVKYFNFTITNVSYSKINDLNELNQTIKQQTNSFNDISEILLPGLLTQCINMTSFPTAFE